MLRRSCPSCDKPTVSLWRLICLGGIRRATCEHCGQAISVSALSFLLLVSVGTWLPLVGALLGAYSVQSTLGRGALVGGFAGLLATTVVLALIYFRGARLVRA